MSTHICCGRVHSGGYGIGHTCGKTAKFERDGKWYCGTHDPVAQKAKSEARPAAYREEWRIKDEARTSNAKAQAETLRRAGCFDDLLEALQFYSNAEVYKPDSVGRTTDLTFVARAAIAKATGGAA